VREKKRTLSDIRDQECRFMKLLSKKSPIKKSSMENLEQQTQKGVRRSDQRELRYEQTKIYPQAQKFEELVVKDFGHENIELTHSKPSDPYCDESVILKQPHCNLNIVERRHAQRKSSLKKMKNDSHDHHPKSSYSNRSL
jgi:hypothetical protein